MMVVGGPSNERRAPCHSAHLITVPPILDTAYARGAERGIVSLPILSPGFGNRWRPALLKQCLAPKDGLHDELCLENFFV